MKKESIKNIINSKFVRSIFLRIISVFLIVIIAIVAIVFFSFTSEINKKIITEKQMQLDSIESTISQRMSEVASIAYNIGNDKSFFFESVTTSKYSDYEISKILERYLVGNDFIEHLAYYRLSEPDTLYTPKGALSFIDFNKTYLGLNDDESQEMIKSVQSNTGTVIKLSNFENADIAYFTCNYPFPQFSKKPQAFVLILIPLSEVKPIIDQELANCTGETVIFDFSGNEVYHTGNLNEKISVDYSFNGNQKNFKYDGDKYVTLKNRSTVNGWTYVSVFRLNDIISGTANRQLIFIILLFALMLIAIFAILACIVVQYKPINNLAVKLNQKGENGERHSLIDEESLISDTFAALKGDSEQKQHFETAFYEAEAANKAKSIFFSNMSHDIRTPMNAIVGMTEIAIDHLDDSEYVKECLSKVRMASGYLLDIINNVLDMSRIESGKFTLSEDITELPKIIHGIIIILNQSLKNKKQKLIVEINNIINEKIITDNIRLTQVFMNILSNSVKFTPEGGTLSVIMNQRSSSSDDYGEYEFIFSDNGIGMSPEFIAQVFDTFSRDNKQNASKTEGTGLGMAIAKNLVELMGGTIKCESELGKGTTFTVTMKIKLADNDTAPPHIPTNCNNHSVLILGNEKRICKNQSKLFAELGVAVKCVSSISEASEQAAQKKSHGQGYGFIIINQSDDDPSGIKAINELSKISVASETTYILAAGDQIAVEKSRAFDSGISAFMQTPLFKSSAVDILNRTFKRSNEISDKKIVDLTGLRVLLVEDNNLNIQMAHAMISKTNAEIYDAMNGKEAVDLFKKHGEGFFDIILMDVQMPVMNGYEATAAIRTMNKSDSLTIPIYAMTANTFDEDVRQVRESGMNGHLGKPYVSEELYRMLAKALKEQ